MYPDNSDSDLVFVYPPDPVVLGDIPHGHGQVIRLGHCEAAVDDGDDVTAVVQGTGHLLVDPVLHLLVTPASVQSSGCADKQEVAGLLNVLQ